MAKIFTISGQAKHGKDTSANIMKECFESKNKKCLIIHYADYLKFIAKEYYGWSGEKDSTGRTLLQKLGTDIGRKRNQNVWVNVVIEFLKTFAQDYDYIFIPDTRFPGEISILRKNGFNTTTFFIHRNDFDNGLTLEQKNHPSETALLDFKFDHIVSVESKIYKLKDALEKIILDYNL
ncbi:MAG: hypothetical protein WA061_02465 [Microgenomates group bacterium]